MRGLRQTHTRAVLLLAGAFVVLAIARPVAADTTVTAANLPLKSSGSASGSSWNLSTNGYLGTYVRLDKSGTLKLTMNALGTSSKGVAPDLTLAIADYKKSFAVTSTTGGYYTYTSPILPAGTYFVRTQLDNSRTVRLNNAPVTLTPKLTLKSLTVGANAKVLSSNTDDNVRAAANTYIDNFRQGTATLKIPGLTAGQAVHVRLTNNAFKLGTYVPGTSLNDVNDYLGSNAPAGSHAANFQSFINGRFNSLVASNAAKWGSNEPSQGNVDMAGSDAMMAYARSHGMQARMHNLLWGDQQPAFVNDLVSRAQNGDAGAKTSLVNAISQRITYTVSYNNYINGATRGNTFTQMDVLNESLHNSKYWRVLGASGVADIYKKTATALAGIGSNAKLYLNEYNVLQYSPSTYSTSTGTLSGSDSYANWYRQHITDVNNAGFAAGGTKNVVGGIGMQYYSTTSGNIPSVGTMQKALQNFSIEGLPMSLTEFGVQDTVRDGTAPQIMDDAIRMMMGTAGVDTFMYWGWDPGATDRLGSGSTLVNSNWRRADGSWDLTAVGKRFEYLYGRGLDPTAPGANADGSNPKPWSTDLTRTVNADGTINFKGFYGDYAVDVGGKTYNFTFNKGTNSYTLQSSAGRLFASDMPEPVGLAIFGMAGMLGLRRSRKC
ncbi:MAG: uncharacterized protein JWM57_3341 [Phycisphaerales bacterium]|nr:uncharacterized protein [Phycisphaerales bacterium]